MAANTSPIAILQPVNSSDGTSTSTSVLGPTLTAAFNDFTGVSAVVAFTANATEGGRIGALRLKPKGTNVATVLRIFINNGGAIGTAGNNQFYDEVGLPATTASATAPLVTLEFPLGGNLRGLNLAPGFRVTVQLATAVAGGWQVVPVDGGRF